MSSQRREKQMSKKKYSTINLFLRSLLFSICMCTMIFFYSFICIALIVVPLRYRHAFIRTYLVAIIYLLKKVCYIDYQLEGLENIPKDRTGIVLCKHQSTWETFMLPLLFHDPAPIAKRELFWVPFFGWGLATVNPIWINRNDKSTAMEQIITQGKKRIADGLWIMVFPEGTRVAPGEVGRYRLGGARLAAKTGSFVIPVAHNAGRCWPRRKFIKRPGTIKLVVGPVIESEGRTSDEILSLAKTWIEDTMVRIDSH